MGLRNLRLANTVINFPTANKYTQAIEIVDFYVTDLDITVTAWVVGDTPPPLLSLGKLVYDHGVVCNGDASMTPERLPNDS